MITKNVTMTVKEATVKLSTKLFLYRNDGNIRFIISIKGLDYKFDSHINNLEKTYTCIRAFNKDNNFKLFLLSDSILDDLEKFINEY